VVPRYWIVTDFVDTMLAFGSYVEPDFVTDLMVTV
jgi:hypothetical protein